MWAKICIAFSPRFGPILVRLSKNSRNMKKMNIVIFLLKNDKKVLTDGVIRLLGIWIQSFTGNNQRLNYFLNSDFAVSGIHSGCIHNRVTQKFHETSQRFCLQKKIRIFLTS